MKKSNSHMLFYVWVQKFNQKRKDKDCVENRYSFVYIYKGGL